MYCVSSQAIAQQMPCPWCKQDVTLLNGPLNEMLSRMQATRRQETVCCPHCKKESWLSNSPLFLVSKEGWAMKDEFQKQKDEGSFFPAGIPVECSGCGFEFNLRPEDADRAGKEYLPFNCPKCKAMNLLPGSPAKPEGGWSIGFGFLRVGLCPACGTLEYRLFPKGMISGGGAVVTCERCGTPYVAGTQEFFNRKYDPKYGAWKDKEEAQVAQYWREYNIRLLCLKAMVAAVVCAMIMTANGFVFSGMPECNNGAGGVGGQYADISGLHIFMIAWPQMMLAIIMAFLCWPWPRRLNGEHIIF